MKTIRKVVFLMLITGAVFGQKPDDATDAAKTQVAAAQTPDTHHRIWANWTKPVIAEENLWSPSYKRIAVTSQFDGLKHLRITSAYIRSEGHSVKMASLGIAISRDLGRDRKLTLEPQIGLAQSAFPKSSEVLQRAVFGYRAQFSSSRLSLESWCQKYTGPERWINCEPALDILVRIAKGFNLGIMTSLYTGPKPAEHNVLQEALHPTTTPDYVRQYYGGPGILWRHGRFDAGCSFEFGLIGGGKGYPGCFGSVALLQWK